MSLIICTVFLRWNGNWKSAKETFPRNNQHAFSRCYTSDRSQLMVKYFMCPEMPKQGMCIYHKLSSLFFFFPRKKNFMCILWMCIHGSYPVVGSCDNAPSPLINFSWTDSSLDFGYQSFYTAYNCYKSLLICKQSYFDSSLQCVVGNGHTESVALHWILGKCVWLLNCSRP